MSSDKKRKCEDSNSKPAAVARKSYEELEEEILELKAKLFDATTNLIEMEKKLEEAMVKSDCEEKNCFSDIEDSVELNPNDPWIAKYLQLREFRAIHGHCQVTKNGNSPKLAKWVSNQRMYYGNMKQGKKGPKLSQERIGLLDGLGFNWGQKYPAPLKWDDYYEELEKYQKAMGHCDVFINASNPSSLAKWVSTQRFEYVRFRKGTHTLLTMDQIGKLNRIGFNWKCRKVT